MGLDNDLWLDTSGLSENLRIFREKTFTARAKTKVPGLAIDQLQAATKELWAASRQLVEHASRSRSTDYFQAAGYTLLALHELYRQEYVPFARSGHVGGLEHFQDGLKPLDALESLPNLSGLQSFFEGQFLAYRLEWLAQPQQFGMEPTGWETQYDAQRRECEGQVKRLRMLSPIEVAIVFLGSRQWEYAIKFCNDEGYNNVTRAEAHTMIGEILAASDFAPRTRDTFDEAISELRQGLDCPMHQRLHYTIAFLHTLYVRPEAFGFPQEWSDPVADEELWVKADELIAGMRFSARVPHANAYGLSEALAGIHEQFPGKTVDREKCLHYAERTIKEVSSSQSRKEVESFGPLAQYWIGYVHDDDVLTPAKERNTAIFIQACEGYVAYVDQMLQHGNRWDNSYIARVYSLLHLPKHGFLDLSRFSIDIDVDDPVLAARQQQLFESGVTTVTTGAAISQGQHSEESASSAQNSAEAQVQADAINRLQVAKDETIQAANRLKQIKSDKALRGFYLGFMREMNARFVASQALSTGMIEKNVGDVRVTIASNVLSLIPVFGSAAQSIFNTVTTAVLEKKMNKYVNNVCKIAINAKQMDALVQDIALAVLTQPGMSERLNQLNKDQKNNTKWFQRLVKFASDTADKIDELFGVFAEKHETEYQEMGALEGVRLLTVVSEGELFIEKDEHGKQVKVVFSERSNEDQVERLQRIVRDKLMAIQVDATKKPASAPAASQPSVPSRPPRTTVVASPTVVPPVSSPSSSNSSSVASASPVSPASPSEKSAIAWKVSNTEESATFGTKRIMTWQFVWRQRSHTMQLRHSSFGCRKVLVDGQLRLKKRGMGGARYNLSFGDGHSVGVQIKSDGDYELFIDNEPFPQAKKFWIDHADA